MEKLCSSNKILDLIFSWVSPILLRNSSFVKQKDTRREVDVEGLFQVLRDSLNVNQTKFELSFGFKESSFQSLLNFQ